MDFGLGAYLEKFEEHFGPRWTKALLIVVGIFIVSTVAAGIVSLVIRPLWIIVQPALPASWTWKTTGSAFFLSLQVGAGMGFGSLMLDAYRRRIATDQLEDLIPRAEAVQKEAKEYYQEAISERKASLENLKETRDMYDKAHEIFTLSEMTLRDILTDAIKSGKLTEEQVNSIQSLLKTESKIRP